MKGARLTRRSSDAQCEAAGQQLSSQQPLQQVRTLVPTASFLHNSVESNRSMGCGSSQVEFPDVALVELPIKMRDPSLSTLGIFKNIHVRFQLVTRKVDRRLDSCVTSLVHGVYSVHTTGLANLSTTSP